jgi:hypothetical protein
MVMSRLKDGQVHLRNLEWCCTDVQAGITVWHWNVILAANMERINYFGILLILIAFSLTKVMKKKS